MVVFFGKKRGSFVENQSSEDMYIAEKLLLIAVEIALRNSSNENKENLEIFTQLLLFSTAAIIAQLKKFGE